LRREDDDETLGGLTANQRVLRGRLGGLACHARNDSTLITQPAREAFMRRFDDLVDPERQLPEGERDRRARLARREYFTRLAFRSSRARQARSARSATDRRGGSR